MRKSQVVIGILLLGAAGAVLVTTMQGPRDEPAPDGAVGDGAPVLRSSPRQGDPRATPHREGTKTEEAHADRQVQPAPAPDAETARIVAEVVDPTGRPLSGVPVFVVRKDPPQPDATVRAAPVRATTDADGKASFDVPTGHVVVFAWGEGWCSRDPGLFVGSDLASSVLVLAAGDEKTVRLPTVRTAALFGRVTDHDGEAVAGCQVVAPQMLRWRDGGTEDPLPIPKTRTGADGTFDLQGLVPGGRGVLHADREGRAQASSEMWTLEPGERRRIDLQFVAPRFVDVAVRIGDTRQPVPGAVVTVTLWDDGTSGFSWGNAIQQVTADARGEARVGPLPSERLTLSAEAAGYVRPQAGPLGGVKGESLAEDATQVTLRLTKGAQITGRVVVPGGAALKDLVLMYGQAGWARSVRIEEDGRFQIRDVATGTYQLEATLRREQRLLRARASVAAGTADVRLVLEEVEDVRMLAVRLRGPAGQPVSTGRVFVRGESASGGWALQQEVQEGRVVFEEIGAGRMWIDVVQPRGGTLGGAYVGPIAEGTREVDVELATARTLSGVVRSSRGKAVAGVRVQAVPLIEGVRTFRPHGVGVTDEAGRYAVGSLGDRAHTLRFEPQDEHLTAEVIVAKGEAPPPVTLRHAPAVTVRVLDANGAPLVGARLSSPQAWQLTGRTARELDFQGLKTDAQGTVELRGLDPEEGFELHIDPPAGRDDVTARQIPDWRPRDETFVLATGRVTRGIVRDERGEPVAGAGVYVHGDGGGPDPVVRSDAQGHFALPALPAEVSQVTLHASLPGLLRAEDAGVARVTPGATDVVLELRRGSSLKVRVEGLLPHTLPSAQLTEQMARPAIQAYAHVDEQGVLTFRGLVRGARYTLWVDGFEDEASHVFRADLAPSDELLVVTPTQGGEIRGRVTAGGDVSLQQVGVALESEVGVRLRAYIEGTSFRIVGVPPGRWAIAGHARDPRGRWLRGRQMASAGDHDVALRVTR